MSTPLAAAIREAGDGYRREFQYSARESPAFLDRTLGPTGDDAVLVRGVVDSIVPVENGIEIVDFKTDAITAASVPQRVERYRPQMELYGRAMSRIWRQPVWKCWLVFLSAHEVVEVSDLTLS
ncbi:MAG: PD-(D/E)XK nuclease family protein [Planctomycetes bacterium]|nr:PD-(D/E)XK nuclease family protein [Planctomycetota bacterium]